MNFLIFIIMAVLCAMGSSYNLLYKLHFLEDVATAQFRDAYLSRALPTQSCGSVAV